MAESALDKVKCPVNLRENQVNIDNLSSNTRNLTLSNVNYPDNSLNELLASVTDVNRRLQNVDKVNKKLRQQHQDMSKENRNQKEQLASLFQENCCLQEKLARLDIDNKNLKKRTTELEEENEKLVKQVKTLQKKVGNDGNISSSSGLGIPLEKRHSSPPILANSDKSLKAISRGPDSNISSERMASNFSLLDVAVPEELMIQEIDVCLNDMNDLKRDLAFVNCNLKYMMHLCFNSKIKGNSHLKHNNPILIGRGGGDFPSVDSLETSFPSVPRENSFSVNSDPNPTLLKLTTNQPNKTRTFQNSNKFCSQEEEDILQGFFKRRHLPRTNSSFTSNLTNVDYDLLSTKIHELSTLKNPDDRPNVNRSVSNEVVISSIPCSSALSPDSLSSNRNINDEEYSYLSSILLKEERVCPICNVVFPKHVPQIDFERHAASHFDFEEYELVNS